MAHRHDDHGEDEHDHHDHGPHEHHAHHGGHHHHGLVSNMFLALLINLVFSLIELVGGAYTGSVAVLSDALHDFGDSVSLGVALVLERMAARRSNAAFSYGYRRLSLLSALITSVILVGGALVILAEAVPRLWNPVQPKTTGMAVLALLGIAVNAFAAWRMKRSQTMNARVISWHFVEDVLGWVTVLIVSVVMRFVRAPILDPLLSILFTAIILWGVFKNLRATIKLFLQGTPEAIDLALLRRDIASINGVIGTHDTHLWSLDGESHVLTLHVVVQSDLSLARIEDLKQTVRTIVAKMGKIHVTMEVESESAVCPSLDCVLES